jgi:hypothetical protein
MDGKADKLEQLLLPQAHLVHLHLQVRLVQYQVARVRQAVLVYLLHLFQALAQAAQVLVSQVLAAHQAQSRLQVHLFQVHQVQSHLQAHQAVAHQAVAHQVHQYQHHQFLAHHHLYHLALHLLPKHLLEANAPYFKRYGATKPIRYILTDQRI